MNCGDKKLKSESCQQKNGWNGLVGLVKPQNSHSHKKRSHSFLLFSLHKFHVKRSSKDQERNKTNLMMNALHKISIINLCQKASSGILMFCEISYLTLFFLSFPPYLIHKSPKKLIRAYNFYNLDLHGSSRNP